MIFLEGLKTRTSREVLEFIDRDILPELRERLEGRLGRIQGTATTARLEAQIAEFTAITSGFRDINSRVQGELFDVASDEVRWFRGMMNDEAGVNLNLTTPDPQQLVSAVTEKPFDGRTLQQWFDKLGDSAQEKVAVGIRRGVTEGQTTQQISSGIMSSIQTTRRQADAIVRSGVAHAANSAREEAFRANSNVIKGLQWTATLDSRTCLRCAPLDGQVFEIGKGPSAPLHVSCRCIKTAVTKSFRSLGVDADDLPAGTRASMNGQVAKDITYNQWLKRQPLDVQEMALGKSRAKLFREGGLDVNQFVNRNRVELTLDQIRQREAAAFAKADL